METNNWNPDKYKQSASFVSNLAIHLVDILNSNKNEIVLDLGCGDGTLAKEIEKSGTKVVGIDLSENMVKKAKENGIEAYVMSATNLDFSDNYFDKVFSNAVLHWVKNLDKNAKEINRVLKRNGKFVAEFGGYGNIKSLCDAMETVFFENKDFGIFENPWNFISDKEYKIILEKNGFKVESIELINRPTKINHIKEWLDVFANGITKNLTIFQKEIFYDEVTKILENKIYNKENGWIADYVRLRVVAYKLENR
ncbi:class I SAM-dependent methyltransferase [Arcobacter sp. CECT 9188]|uniref:class I SAM-dependent methyltransferase n=1 Tax=Arcobacter sp. CECT 9188 TaxID=2044505 RepID=UPI000DEB3860|nr:class I SAM-dependent methyltransferase [Arcobacter sp. CECT 9188]RBQ26253.1 SAM-dependent methyltransferase [Arcobacter sp. CECT 9188]